MKKRILITGSNGLLGQKLIKQLHNHPDFELIATSRGENRIKQIEGFQYHSLDICKSEEVSKLFDQLTPDIVINTAAMTNVDACESDREACWKLNVDAVSYLIQSCEKHQSHLIHISTDFIFDGKNGPYSEEDKANPLSYYGKSKLASEQLVEKANTNWAILRTVLVYGIVEDMSRSNIVLWAKGALEKKQNLKIVNDQFRTPTLAEDLASACVLVAEKGAKGIYNISGKDFMSIYELVKRVAAYYKLDTSTLEEVSSADLKQPANRPPVTGFILDKAINELGYKPHSFEEGIAILESQL